MNVARDIGSFWLKVKREKWHKPLVVPRGYIRPATTGLQGLRRESGGSYRMRVHLGDCSGDIFLSKEFWEAIGEHAGWKKR